MDSLANISKNVPDLTFNAHCYGDKQNGFLTIDDQFLQRNKAIFNQPRGFGYWLWKPYIIFETLREINLGDWVIYSDAGIEVISSIMPLLAFDQDIFLFGNEWPHVDFCKKHVLEAMLPGWFNPAQKQVQASVILMRKTPATMRFVWEWLEWCQKPGFIDDSPSLTPNIDSFNEHRHDQSILTNIAIKHNILPLHWWPAVYPAGDGHIIHKHLYPQDTYEILFLHHRKRNSEW